MASIKKRKSTFSVIYWYLDNAGERKQKWDTLETKKEAKQRKAKRRQCRPYESTCSRKIGNSRGCSAECP